MQHTRIARRSIELREHRRVRAIAAATLLFAFPATSALGFDSASKVQARVQAISIAALHERATTEGTVRVIVRLAEPEIPWWANVLHIEHTVRRWELAEEQDEVLADLAGASTSGLSSLSRARRVRRFRDAPFMALDADSYVLDALERSKGVLSIEEDRLFAATLKESIPIIGADQSVNAGHDGTGWAVAVIDTGIDSSHDFLSGRVVAEACFSANGSCPNGETSQIGMGAGMSCDYTTTCFHGTHVAGIVAGSDSDSKGVAPGASIISIQVFSKFTGSICGRSNDDSCALAYTSDIVAALEHVDALRATHDIAAANLSLGGGSWTSQTLCDASNPALKSAIDRLRDAGVVSVAASGNEGSLDAMGAPACISSAVSVGAGNNSDRIASFSNSADFLDLIAPGFAIVSSVPLALMGFDTGVAGGTSMATPHIAGLAALLLEAEPKRSVARLERAILGSCKRPKEMKRGRGGAGIPDAVQALEAL